MVMGELSYSEIRQVIPSRTKTIPIITAINTGLSIDIAPRINETIPKIIINIEAIFDTPSPEKIPAIPNRISRIPIIQNCNPKRNDNASMLNMNNKPNMMARTPIITFSAENSVSIDAIPKNNKLTPIRMDTIPELIRENYKN